MRPKKAVVLVIDGQGGGIGAAIIKRLREEYGEAVEIWGIGANAIATAAMMKAKANRGATGENSIVVATQKAQVIIAPLAVTWPNAMLGEITTAMAGAITSSPAPRILLPLTQEDSYLVGLTKEPLPHLVDEAINMFKELSSHV